MFFLFLFSFVPMFLSFVLHAFALTVTDLSRAVRLIFPLRILILSPLHFVWLFEISTSDTYCMTTYPFIHVIFIHVQ